MAQDNEDEKKAPGKAGRPGPPSLCWPRSAQRPGNASATRAAGGRPRAVDARADGVNGR